MFLFAFIFQMVIVGMQGIGFCIFIQGGGYICILSGKKISSPAMFPMMSHRKPRESKRRAVPPPETQPIHHSGQGNKQQAR